MAYVKKDPATVKKARQAAAASRWKKPAKAAASEPNPRHRKDSKPDAARGLKVTTMADQPRVDVSAPLAYLHAMGENDAALEASLPEPNSDRQHMVDHTHDVDRPVPLSERLRQMREAE